MFYKDKEEKNQEKYREYKDTFSGELINDLLEKNKTSFQHNHLPYERAKYIQTFWHPFNPDQLITVATVVRTNFYNPNGAAHEENENTRGSFKKTKQSFGYPRKYEYIKLSSDGPAPIDGLSGEETDNDVVADPGSGKWTINEKQQPQKIELEFQEFLLLALWKFDEAQNLLECLVEVPIINSVRDSGNTQPLKISVQSKVVFWFEQEDTVIYYCQIKLEGTIGIEKTPVINIEGFKDQFNGPDYMNSISRWNMGEDQILAFSKWEGKAFYLSFYSLKTRSELWRIPNMDRVIDLNPESKEIWMLGQEINSQTQDQTAMVACHSFGNNNPIAFFRDVKKNSQFVVVMKDHFHMECVLMNDRKRLIVLLDYQHVFVVDLQASTSQMATEFYPIQGSDTYMFLTGNSGQIYLVQLQKRNMNKVEQDDQRNGRLMFHDLSQPYNFRQPTFEDYIRVDSNSFRAPTTPLMQQQIQINDKLQFKMMLITADQTQFSVAISNSQSQPVHPVHQHWAIKYPCIMMKDPRPMDKTLTLMNFMHPEKIFQLYLKDYRIVTFVEQHLGHFQKNVFTILAQKGQDMYILKFTVHPFFQPTEECVTWKIYAKCKPLLHYQIKTDRIINAKLMILNNEKKSDQKYQAIVIQYEQALVAVDLIFKDKWVWIPRVEESKPKVHNREERFQRVQVQDNLGETDTYSFGVEICSPKSLIPKQIMLGKLGDCVYYLVNEKNNQVLMKVEHKPPIQNENYDLGVLTYPLFTCYDHKVCFCALDADQQKKSSKEPDFFYLLDTSGILVRLSQVKKQFEDKPHCEVLLKIDINSIPSSQLLLNEIQKRPWTMVATGEGCFSWTKHTFSLTEHKPILFSTVEGAEMVTWLRNVYDTESFVGVCQIPKKKALNFFMKPNIHSRAIEMGVTSPQFTSFFGRDTIMYTWFQGKQLQTHIFNTNGKYCGQVKEPEGLEGFTPILVSTDLRFFLLQRQRGIKEGYVASIDKNNNGQFEWIKNKEINKLIDLSRRDPEAQDSSEQPELQNERKIIYFVKELAGVGGRGGKGKQKNKENQILKQKNSKEQECGELISVEFSYEKDQAGDTIWAKCEYQVQYTKYYIQFGERSGAKKNYSQPRKVILQQNRLVIMGQDLKIIYFELNKVKTDFCKIDEVQKISLKLQTLSKNGSSNEMFDIVPTACLSFIQITTPYNLIIWNLRQNKQFRELNGFKTLFDNAKDYIVTGFKIPYEFQLCEVQYIEFSQKQDFVREQQQSRIYRLYSELDLRKLKVIEKEMKDPDIKKLSKMDPKLFASTFESQTMFHLYHNNIQVITAMIHALASKETFEEENKQAQEALYKRTIFQLMRTNQGDSTPFNLAVKKKNFQNFDTFLGLALRIQDENISRKFLNDFTYVVGTSTDKIFKFFDQKFCRNRSCDLIEKVFWTEDSTEAFLTSRSSIITRKEIEALTAPGFQVPEDKLQVAKDSDDEDGDNKTKTRYLFMNNQKIQSQLSQEANEKTVDVMMLDFDWLFEKDGENNSNVQTLIRLLEDTENDSLFATKQISIFTELLWKEYYPAIFNKMFLNFMRYFLSVVIYFTFFLGDESGWGPGYELASILLQVMISVDILCVCAVEFVQARKSGLRNYLSDLWNWLDIFSIGMNTLILVLNETWVDFHMIRQLAIFAVLMMWFKLFYWMRLFEATASFIRMTKEIFVDIKAFMVMLIITVCTFANAFLIMDQSRRILGIEPITEDAFGYPVADTVTRAYMLGLGEYGTDTYELFDSKLAWALFIVATFLLQVTFFNLLISIMGDTFDRVSEVKVQSALKEKLQMIGDHQGILDINKTFEDKRYVFYVQQVSVEGQTNDAWEGRIGKLKLVIQSQLKMTNKVIERKFDVIEQGLKKFEDQITKNINKLAETIKGDSEKKKLVNDMNAFRL